MKCSSALAAAMAFSAALFLIPSLGCGGSRTEAVTTSTPGSTTPGSGTPGAALSVGGKSAYGTWSAQVIGANGAWKPGDSVKLQVVLGLQDGYLSALSKAGYPVDQLFVLVTAERSFDADGLARLPSDENMSTLLTPTGLAIEGGNQGPVTTRYGGYYASPLELYQELPASSLVAAAGDWKASFDLAGTLPSDLPPGLYRLRFDFGIKTQKRNMDLNGAYMGSRPFSSDLGVFTYAYSSIIPASGTSVSGGQVDGAAIKARIPWVLLASYNSNGYNGVVADEDKGYYALSPRNIIPDEVVLPLYSGGSTNVNSYSLEPGLPIDRIDPRAVTAWDWTKGELTVSVTAPDGATQNLGTSPITGKTSYPGPTTGNKALTAWKPTMYGRYTVSVTGWMADASGRRYEGGGTYHFWIAKRMTMATATFQGMAYPVGTKYGRDIGFSPAVPADVEVTATLYPNSDPGAVKSLTYSGKATRGGVFGTAQGLQAFTLDTPGEYHAKILAKYTDPEGHLWVCVMRHAGVVYPTTSTITAHGKKLNANGAYVNLGETGKEGYVDANGTSHLEHITFPYNSGDALLIASEGHSANKIEPVLTYTNAGDDPKWNTKLNGVGTTNLCFTTTNGYSPHLFPEYIKDRQYYYGAAARPGFMSRFVVGDSVCRAPYWATSPNSFGGQIGASSNGDLPGDIYRLFGGVIVRNASATPAYAGYLSSGFILPKGSNNNRIIAAGSEDIAGATGDKARFFLVGLRPGMTYLVGAAFRPFVQIDPIVPASITYTLNAPDGSQKIASGTGDATGSWVGTSAWTLDMPGIYTYNLAATWDGHSAVMPGLANSTGMFFVVPDALPAGAAGLGVGLPNQSSFPADGTLTVKGTSTASVVKYALLMPGAVLDQGELTVANGAFSFVIDPAALNKKAPIYDIRNNTSGTAQLGKVLHLTLCAKEKMPDGTEYWDMRRVIVRGTTVMNTR